MNIIFGCKQHIGSRKSQQDDFGFSDKDNEGFLQHGGFLAIVADGMGGLAGGGDASRIAKQTFLQAYLAKKSTEPVGEALRRSLHEANEAVYAHAQRIGEAGNCGTTLVAAVIHAQQLYWISVGDSRLYLYRDQEIRQLTEDHSLHQQLMQEVAAGRMSREAADRHPERRALTSFVGSPDLQLVDANVRPFPLEKNDRLLLCSDGLYGGLSEKEMSQLLLDPPPKAADMLVWSVLDKQITHQDNITVVVLACEVNGDTVRQPSRRMAEASAAIRPSHAPQKSRRMKVLFIFLALLCLLAVSTAAYFGWKKLFPGQPLKKESQIQSMPGDLKRQIEKSPAQEAGEHQDAPMENSTAVGQEDKKSASASTQLDEQESKSPQVKPGDATKQDDGEKIPQADTEGQAEKIEKDPAVLDTKPPGGAKGPVNKAAGAGQSSATSEKASDVALPGTASLEGGNPEVDPAATPGQVEDANQLLLNERAAEELYNSAQESERFGDWNAACKSLQDAVNKYHSEKAEKEVPRVCGEKQRAMREAKFKHGTATER